MRHNGGKLYTTPDILAVRPNKFLARNPFLLANGPPLFAEGPFLLAPHTFLLADNPCGFGPLQFLARRPFLLALHPRSFGQPAFFVGHTYFHWPSIQKFWPDILHFGRAVWLLKSSANLQCTQKMDLLHGAKWSRRALHASLSTLSWRDK